ncbi:MAG TPA: bacillithiol biosynthesis cysteine-adding enzyme BshC [Chitinophagaceae bacterium]|nr:bacillithiol biosynthesis cysteine-adding enzyme BshC [Chitinophagaceae bacterium]
MDCIATRIPYRQTGYFSKTVLDYIDQSASLKPFFTYPPSLQGIQKAIDARKKQQVDRKTLVQHLKKQYETVPANKKIQENIEALLSPDAFTITTAHQPNIFTGPLYFIYKILHTIRVADHLKNSFPKYNFVPVFYMGSEDADIAELGHFHLDGQKLEWNTKQTGAVGRMKIDKEFIKLIAQFEGQLSVLPFGAEIIALVKSSYRENSSIQDATFSFVHALFAEFGLIVLISDDAELKRQMIRVFEDDLMNQTASGIVEQTVERLRDAGYKVQANPREINLFYLEENMRERIVIQNSKFRIQNSGLSFTEDEIKKELSAHPERFSPNVIIRGLYQETILPNLVFIGGGGELAYWLQLRDLFAHYKVSYPLLLLRNSFLIVEKKWQDKIHKLGFSVEDFFLSEEELMNRLVEKESKHNIKLNGTFKETEQLYESIKKHAAAIDSTLSQHVDALKTQSLHRLQELEKKMLRAEKRKFSDQQRQVHAIKEKLFPSNALQERYDNFMSYYAKWGKDFFKQLYEFSLNLEQEFVVVSEK